MAYHNDVENRNLTAVSSLNRANTLSFLTDALVAAADTRAGLKSAIDGVVVHNDAENIKLRLKTGIDVAGLADADIASLTTVAGLIALLEVSTTAQGLFD